MKWWYVVVLLIGIGIGWWILGISAIKKTTTVAENSALKNALPTMMVTDKSGNKVSAVEVTGVVKNWNPDNGELGVVSDNQTLDLVIDPDSMTIFTISIKNKGQELIVNSKVGLRWTTAFCEGDMVSIELSSNKVILIDNNGYRLCGYKGE